MAQIMVHTKRLRAACIIEASDGEDAELVDYLDCHQEEWNVSSFCRMG